MKEKPKNKAFAAVARPAGGLAGMIDRIIQENHPAIRRNVAWLKQVFAKVVQVHDHEHPEIVPAYMLFLQMSDDLERHMVKEESVIFPYLLKAGKAAAQGESPDPSALNYRGGDNPLQIILWEHEATRQDWTELKKMTSDFTAPDECGYVQAVYWGLKRLEPALAAHLDLETNGLYRQVKMDRWLR